MGLHCWTGRHPYILVGEEPEPRFRRDFLLSYTGYASIALLICLVWALGFDLKYVISDVWRNFAIALISNEILIPNVDERLGSNDECHEIACNSSSS